MPSGAGTTAEWIVAVALVGNAKFLHFAGLGIFSRPIESDMLKYGIQKYPSLSGAALKGMRFGPGNS